MHRAATKGDRDKGPDNSHLARSLQTSPHPKHSDAWCLERSLLADANTQRNKKLKTMGQAHETLLKMKERRDELLSVIALESPAVDSRDPLDLKLLLLEHTVVLKLKTRVESAVAHASQDMTDVISEIKSQREQYCARHTREAQTTYTKLTLAQKLEIIRRRDYPDDFSTIRELAANFQVPL